MGLRTSTVTWIGSVQMFVLFLSGIIIGPAFDKWGARKLMLSGTFLCLIAFLACSFAKEFYQLLLAQGFLFGLGCALLFYPTTSAVSEWFDKNRGLALGLVVSGASAGGILWPMALNQLFIRLGTSWTHRVAATVSVPLTLISCILVRERKDVAGHDTAGHEIKASQRSISKAICDLRFLGLSIALLFIDCGMMVPFFYIPQYANDQSVELTMANNLLAISYVASLFGRIVTGWVGDHIGR
ncbi:Major facilitator superfamily domain, general substrate transporter [Cordyceps fumosorosea ARSEF 2679]|uniref:Major facilitator superfamily domain, general substrate transporter n=1 Tax=Cordyceps fumosorosea (strain ARSEF 2679) TaxID=1081104 RepID=A0A167QL88_CORFA|nr:Major facilitator superfamily domain, general substrate transporter [Cordyceps fumosorosea ARSEF 2679]OAA57741.1 Major facilitator superfamily domain, general substrate transporter [Cordyceps fumosorosea ARSEF 2679]